MVNEPKPTAKHLKCAVLSYFRFLHHHIPATEVDYGKIGGIADVLIDTGRQIYEIEIKISKNDLIYNEVKKTKHASLADPYEYLDRLPNRFYLCVPHYMIKDAREFILDTNSRYGLLEYKQGAQYIHRACDRICEVKSAGVIHPQYNKKFAEYIALRATSELCNFYEKMDLTE